MMVVVVSGLEAAMNQTNALLDREQKESELSTKFAIQVGIGDARKLVALGWLRQRRLTTSGE